MVYHQFEVPWKKGSRVTYQKKTADLPQGTGRNRCSSRQSTGLDQGIFPHPQGPGRSLPGHRLPVSGTFKVLAHRQAEEVIFVDFTVVLAYITV